jgi:hypothetical protein
VPLATVQKNPTRDVSLNECVESSSGSFGWTIPVLGTGKEQGRMREDRSIEIALEMCRTADAAHEAAAELAYALRLAAKGANPSDGRTGYAAKKADATFVSPDKALEKLLKSCGQTARCLRSRS